MVCSSQKSSCHFFAGTVIVNPEPVEETKLEFKGPEFDTFGGKKQKNFDFGEYGSHKPFVV